MWAFLQHLSFWDWLALGTILLILEVFGAGGYLLWIGLAAAAVGVLTFLIPGLPWELQLLLFGVLSILTALYWWQRQRSAVRTSDQPNLNLRGQDLIGRVFVVHQAIINGRGKIKVADGVWMARGPDAPAGSRVRVTGLDGVVILVEHAD
ncbi:MULTISPECIES: NfeD family protein [unclassified Pseudomonas]|uniref:NfeD family protein n=1 Tax=unclassified Pseudomonas TaxID=196821 RepID=UPI000CD15D75|nr:MULTISPECIES: NfeD family protein [unclassified Pseudomonas]POA29466.1 NfeD family protein [Pseudomonas sp. GW456-R21]POA64815.1 NfeD family protein [Pseudomonas sp. GW460-R15]